MGENDGTLEERVSAKDGFSAVAKIFSNDPEQIVISDDELLEKMKKELEKKIAKSNDVTEKANLEKELLILQILILQREKIDKEADVILNNGDTFGIDLESDKIKEKKKKERDKKQKALLDKLNQLGISDLDIEIKPPKDQKNGREKGGMQRQRTR